MKPSFENESEKSMHENESSDNAQIIDKLTHALSHDLRSPLHSISSLLKLMKNKYESSLPDEGKKFLTLILSGVDELDHRTEDLVSYFHLRQRTLTRVPISMDSLVKQTLDELIYPEYGQKNEIIVHPLPSMKVDHDLLKMVFYHLISNALKFSKDKNNIRIKIGTISKNDKLIFYIKDNGVGFDMRYAKNLFGLFQRFHGADEYKGSGLGLAKVEYIIHRHHGRIWAESTVNAGSTFYFTIGD